MDETSKNADHSLSYSKNQLIITGVKEVLSFEDKEVYLSLTNNSMTIKGSQLTVAELNLKSGSLKIDGQLESITYSHSAQKMGLVKRLFK